MLSNKLHQELNQQIIEEIASSYLYLSMSAYFEKEELRGFAHWMRAQAGEELEHAMKLFHYLSQSGSRVTLKELEAPQSEWSSPLAAFEAALDHEKYITGLINELVNQARKDQDDDSLKMLAWFVDEQEEEEESASAVIEKIKASEGDDTKMKALDQKLGQRKSNQS